MGQGPDLGEHRPDPPPCAGLSDPWCNWSGLNPRIVSVTDQAAQLPAVVRRVLDVIRADQFLLGLPP